MSPEIDISRQIFSFEAPSFDWIFSLYLGLTTVFLTILFLRLRSQLQLEKLRNEDFWKILSVVGFGFFSFVLAFIGILRANGNNLSILNFIADGLIPWRFLYIGVTVTFVILLFVSLDGTYLKSVSAGILIFFLVIGIYLGAFPVVSYSSAPSVSSLSSLNGSRVLLPEPVLGNVSGPVAYSDLYNYTTTSGPYSQGDPSFYYLTAYYEWVDTYAYSQFAYSLAQLTGSTKIVYAQNMSLDNLTFSNYYHMGPYSYPIYNFNPSPSMADEVTPICLLASNNTEALMFSLFVNIIGEDGYKLTFTTECNAIKTYGTVLVQPDQITVESLHNKTIFSTPAGQIALGYFPRGYVMAYPQDISTNPYIVGEATNLSHFMISFFHPVYEPLPVKVESNGYLIAGQSSYPILLKASYYPYFTGPNYTFNTYHFILLPPGKDIRLSWHLPFYTVSLGISIIGIVGATVYFTSPKVRKKSSSVEGLQL